MAVQGLFLRSVQIFSNHKILLSNRILHANLQPSVMGLKQKTKEKLKTLNIPEKPKRPPTPYIKYVIDHRQTILQENPNLKQTEILKKCAEAWKIEHSTVKDKYTNEYKDESEDYNTKILKYSAALTSEQKEAIKSVENEKKDDKKKRKLRKLYKETNKPKRPLVPYMLYLLDQSKVMNKPINILMKEIKGQWMNLPEPEKEKYVIQAAKEKKHYEAAMKEWEVKMLNEGHDNLVRVKSLEEKRPSRVRKEKVKSE